LLLVATRAASGADAPALVAGTTFAGLGGLAVGLICNGLSAGRGLEPSRTSVGLRALPPWLARGVATALVLGLPFSVCVGAIAGVEYGGRNGISTGLTILAVISLALGATIGIGRWLGAPVPDQEPPSPAAVLRADRAALLVAALVSGLATGVAAGVFVNAVDALRLDVLAYASPWRTGLACGVVVFGVVLCGSGSPWFWFVLARMWFTAVRHRLPWNLIRFLDAATIDQILRTSGPVYQFRHKPLRDHLAKQYRRGRPSWWLIGHADGTPSTPDRGVHVGRWGAAGRAALSALALAALLAGAAVTIAPQLIRFTGIRDVRVDNEQARTLLRAADGMQPAHPVDALRLRIAAASVDSDQGARDDLAAYLRMRLAAPPYAVLRTNRVVASGSWVVTLDEHGVVTKWDLRAARPQGEEVDRRSFDVVALGQTGWVELFGLDGHARLVDLAGDRGPIDLGTAPDSVEAIGVTGWVVVTDSGTVTAWHLSAVAPKPVPLAEQSSAVRVVDATGWVVVLDHATATAWQPHEGGLRSSVLDYQVDGLRGQPYDIVELDQVDGGVRSQWDLPAYPAAPVEVDSRLGEVPQAVFSSLDGRWVFADRGDGTTVLDTRSTGSRGVRLTAEPALAPGPGAWVITSSGDTGAAAWNLAARPPARIPLGPPAAGVVDGPPPWIVVDAGSTRSAWNLAASPPQGVPLGTVAGTEVGVGGWLLVHPGGGAPMVGWRLDGIPTGPLPLRDGALQAQLSAGGDWAVVSFTDEAVESLTAVVQAPYPAPPLPAGAAADPVAYACGIARRGLTPAEWERYAPGIPYRKTCAG
ncbi:MAG TPA: hypothetical protein VJT31_24855, partial [Rugosimonospora sp.]|nr:hypothetical protein [Rugosimonospora sp.]